DGYGAGSYRVRVVPNVPCEREGSDARTPARRGHESADPVTQSRYTGTSFTDSGPGASARSVKRSGKPKGPVRRHALRCWLRPRPMTGFREHDAAARGSDSTWRVYGLFAH